MVTWTPIDGAPFGIRLGDLGTGTAAGELQTLLARHHVLIVPGELTDDEHVAFLSSFGRVLPQGPRVLVNDRPAGDHPIVTYVTNQTPGEGLGSFELLFHHDLAHVPTPLGGLSLYALEVAPDQVPTRFANGVLAYRRLPQHVRTRLERLQGLFIGNYTTITDHAVSARRARDLVDPTWPHAVHPVVVTHPLTGEPCLFLNEMQTTAILGLPQTESDALLDELFAVLYDPAGIYEHHWRSGELVVWDNLVLQHGRDRITSDAPRVLRRVVFGEKAPWEDWPQRNFI